MNKYKCVCDPLVNVLEVFFLVRIAKVCHPMYNMHTTLHLHSKYKYSHKQPVSVCVAMTINLRTIHNPQSTALANYNYAH